jgi:hypothetical protein
MRRQCAQGGGRRFRMAVLPQASRLTRPHPAGSVRRGDERQLYPPMRNFRGSGVSIVDVPPQGDPLWPPGHGTSIPCSCRPNKSLLHTRALIETSNSRSIGDLRVSQHSSASVSLCLRLFPLRILQISSLGPQVSSQSDARVGSSNAVSDVDHENGCVAARVPSLPSPVLVVPAHVMDSVHSHDERPRVQVHGVGGGVQGVTASTHHCA